MGLEQVTCKNNTNVVHTHMRLTVKVFLKRFSKERRLLTN